MRTFLFTIILATALMACAPLQELLAGEAGNVDMVSSDDPEMNAAIQEARDTLPLFLEALQSPELAQAYFSIKAAFPYGSGNTSEHIWLEDISFDGEVFRGALANEPVYVPDLHLGDRVTIQMVDVSDWMIVHDGSLLGGFTIYVLRGRMTDQERVQFDRESGLVFGDRPILP